jgi:hypothetical protein
MHAICELSAGLTNSDHSTWFTGSDAVRFSTQGELVEEALSIPILLFYYLCQEEEEKLGTFQDIWLLVFHTVLGLLLLLPTLN